MSQATNNQTGTDDEKTQRMLESEPNGYPQLIKMLIKLQATIMIRSWKNILQTWRVRGLINHQYAPTLILIFEINLKHVINEKKKVNFWKNIPSYGEKVGVKVPSSTVFLFWNAPLNIPSSYCSVMTHIIFREKTSSGYR